MKGVAPGVILLEKSGAQGTGHKAQATSFIFFTRPRRHRKNIMGGHHRTHKSYPHFF
tara:strand:- start:323 stop:493 length:171 start_codon:yes stop_codon:yes gene_type:complete